MNIFSKNEKSFYCFYSRIFNLCKGALAFFNKNPNRPLGGEAPRKKVLAISFKVGDFSSITMFCSVNRITLTC